MEYVIVGVVAFALGAAVVMVAGLTWHSRVQAKAKQSEQRLKNATELLAAATAKESEVNETWRQQNEAIQYQHAASAQQLAEMERQATKRVADGEQQLAAKLREFNSRVISYRELQQENSILKRDLQNIDVNLHKLELDGETRQFELEKLNERSDTLAQRYLQETVKSVASNIGSNNYATCKTRLTDVIERVRGVGFNVPPEEEQRLLNDLKELFEKAVRAEFEREEQSRIKAQIREEERLKREVERELKQLERERLAVQAALDQALAEAQGRHSEEVERLKARLFEAEAKSQRAISLAQQTKTGYVYVISNIGTLGADVYKVGMTRRLNPMERVVELGDASVPFPFDVHMMIHCNDAPALENALHRALHKMRVNKTNPRKEFFRVPLDEILKVVVEHHGDVQYVADPEALQYRQSLTMSDEDAELIEQTYEQIADDTDATVGED